MFNSIYLVGRLTSDPVLQKSQNGNEYISISIADNSRKDVQYFNSYVYNLNDKMKDKYLKWRKGDIISVSGRLQVTKKEEKTYISIIVNDSSFISSSFKNQSLDSECN